MKWVDLGILALLAMAVPACGDDGRMMSDYARDLDVHIEMLASEQDAHSAAVAEAIDSDVVHRAETDHERQMDHRMRMMDGVVGNMMSCGNPPAGAFDSAPFARMMQEMREESDGHRKEMTGATNLMNAKLIELMHQRAVQERLTTMRHDMHTMMGFTTGHHCNR